MVISCAFRFVIQFGLFLAFLGVFIARGAHVQPTLWVLFAPVLVVQMGLLGLGFGIAVSSLTTRYRDLTNLVGFGVQLWMFATPVVYPLSQIPDRYRLAYSLNPMVSVVESFREMFLGTSALTPQIVALSITGTFIALFIALVLFSRVERTFMDTV